MVTLSPFVLRIHEHDTLIPLNGCPRFRGNSIQPVSISLGCRTVEDIGSSAPLGQRHRDPLVGEPARLHPRVLPCHGIPGVAGPQPSSKRGTGWPHFREGPPLPPAAQTAFANLRGRHSSNILNSLGRLQWLESCGPARSMGERDYGRRLACNLATSSPGARKIVRRDNDGGGRSGQSFK